MFSSLLVYFLFSSSMSCAVYLAEAGYLLGQAGVPKQAILTSLAGKQTPDLHCFQQVLQGLPAGSRPTLQYFTPTERHRKKSVVLHLDYTWCASSIKQCAVES